MPKDPAVRSTGVPRWVPVSLVVLLAAVVVGLVAFALLRTDDTSGAGASSDRTTLPTTGASASASASSTVASATPSATAATVPDPGSGERFLAVGNGILWRATAGECGVTAPSLERSTNAGASWTDVTPNYLGVAQILGLSAFSGDQAQVIALVGSTCETQALRTYTDGQFWAADADALAAASYVDPTVDGEIVTPAGSIAAPCDAPWGLRTGESGTALVCDSVAYDLADDGSWTPVAESAAAVTVTSTATIAAEKLTDCSGLMVDTTCVQLTLPAVPAAMIVSGTAAILWAGTDFVETTLAG